MNTKEMGEKASQMAQEASEQAQNWQETGKRKAREAAQAAGAYAQENTWQTIGMAAGLGFLLGFVLARLKD